MLKSEAGAVGMGVNSEGKPGRTLEIVNVGQMTRFGSTSNASISDSGSPNPVAVTTVSASILITKQVANHMQGARFKRD